MISMIKHVLVMGAGVMGSGITQVAAQSGYEVTMMDISQDIVKKGLAAIEKGLSRGMQKGTISESDKARAMSRVSTATDLSAARDADLVIEAVPEVLQMKLDVFRKLDAICPEHTILASNTSSLPIGAMAAVTSPTRQPRVIGIHFMKLFG